MTTIYVSGLNYNVGLFGTTLRPNFSVLENFHRKFVNLVAPPTDVGLTTKRLVRCKAHPVL